MMVDLKNKRLLPSRPLVAALGAAAGVAVFVWVYGISPLDVGWDSWIMAGYDEWDVQQHYAGWLLFRNAHWMFPLGMTDTIALPAGTAISYTDSLPWVSIALKLMRGFLPPTFQWFGWYVLFCFAMQGAAGALLCLRGALTGRAPVLAAPVCGALFACLPTLWDRAFHHTALASQWLFLFALYFYLEDRAALRAGALPRVCWWGPALAFVAVGIHPYFLPPVLACVFLWAVDCARLGGGARRAASDLALSLAATLVGAVLCGALGTGGDISREGYGEFSMNLNALVNPSSRGGYTWSRLLPVLPQAPEQYDGFNYLGLGVLALVAVALALSVPALRRHPAMVGGWWGRNAPVFAVCLCMALFAISNQIYWGKTGVEFSLPAPVLSLCGIFRSSGRMFYLVTACMLVWAVYTVRGACARLARPGVAVCAVLALALAVQVWDLGLVAAQKRQYFSDAYAQADGETLINHKMTDDIGVGHATLLAAGEVRGDRLRPLAILAGKQGLATNLDISVSGASDAAARDRAETLALLQSGQYDRTAIYVTTDESVWQGWQQVFAGDDTLVFFVADSCYFLYPMPG